MRCRGGGSDWWVIVECYRKGKEIRCIVIVLRDK